MIYYWFTDDDQILLLLAYPKNERENLTPAQVKQLRKLVEMELK